MAAEERLYEPPWTQRALSAFTIGSVGFLCRSFLYGLSKTETHGLERFLEVVDARLDESKRQRGLLTVSNHMSVYGLPSTPAKRGSKSLL
jgi:monolysocardiolipin acyltransferase